MTIVPLIVGYFAIQWNRGNYLGKTPEQIVAMGRKKWSDLYEEKVGGSTADTVLGQEKFGEALRNLNDRAMKRMPSPRQKWLSTARELTTNFAYEAHRVGEFVSGGGSIWRVFDASIAPDVEELVADSIVKKKMPMVKMKSFESANKELDAAIERAKTEGTISKDREMELASHRRKLSTAEAKLHSHLNHAPQYDVTRFRLYIHKELGEASGAVN